MMTALFILLCAMSVVPLCVILLGCWYICASQAPTASHAALGGLALGILFVAADGLDYGMASGNAGMTLLATVAITLLLRASSPLWAKVRTAFR